MYGRNLRPLGYQKLTSFGSMPIGYQQFFVADIVKLHPYSPNDECIEPELFTLEELEYIYYPSNKNILEINND